MIRLLWRSSLKFILLSVSVVCFWLAIIWIFSPPVWLLPTPAMVFSRAQELLHHGSLLHHLRVTLLEICLGYLLGVSAGLITGYPISQLRILEKVMTPYLVAGNSIPLIAFAPVLILWLGNGVMTKVIVTALIVYLPMTISTLTGFRTQKPILKRLMRTLRSSKLQRFMYLEIPNAMPGILSGMKIGAPLAVVGAVVAEFLGSGEGLGHLVLEANGLLDTSQLFVTNILLGIIGIVFFSLVQLLETLILGDWHHRRQAR